MKIDAYHPIRQRMVWVAVIQSAASGLVLAGVSADILEGWSNWAVGVLNIFVLVGVLAKGTASAEENTTPVTDLGEPINPDYRLVA